MDYGASLKNRLAAIAALSHSIVREVETLRVSNNLDFESGDLDMEREVRRLEMDLIRCALLRSEGNMTKAARLLKLKYTTFYSKVRRYSIETEYLGHSDSVENFQEAWADNSYRGGGADDLDLPSARPN